MQLNRLIGVVRAAGRKAAVLAYPRAEPILINTDQFTKKPLNCRDPTWKWIICHYIRRALAAASDMSYKVRRWLKVAD